MLSTDASTDTWAAILLRKHQNGEKLCRYASGQFKWNQLNYWPAEKEILAAINGAEKLHPYLVAEEFILQTDSTTPASFMKIKLVSSPKLQRYTWWQYRLSQYVFTIAVVPSKQHFLPNALTREMKMSQAYKHVWNEWSLATPRDRILWCQAIHHAFPDHASALRGEYLNIDCFYTSSGCISVAVNNLKWSELEIGILN